MREGCIHLTPCTARLPFTARLLLFALQNDATMLSSPVSDT
jgi:hypothetical protein